MNSFQIKLVAIAFLFPLFGEVNAIDLPGKTIILFKSGINDNRYSAEWKKAVESRLSESRLDSLASTSRNLTTDEKEWEALIASKISGWNAMRDSLLVPFRDTIIPDTIFVMVGFLWKDDGFSYNLNTVCFDVTAMLQNYGSASLLENSNRIDRIFAHEFTHIIHKNWVKQNHVVIKNFRDSILWECLYEGVGMYRSLTDKWFSPDKAIPEITRNALNELIPILSEKLKIINLRQDFSKVEKERINAGLSRGPVQKKWGAFPIAIWLSLEANGNDKNLKKWISMGPEAVSALAKKYMKN